MQIIQNGLKNAFRLIPTRPSDFKPLGFCFRELYYFDKALPFGASISCSTFEEFSTFLELCVKQRSNSKWLIHYLDDFLGAENTDVACQKAMAIFRTIMQEINVPLADEKTEGPSEVIIFWGLELDSLNMIVRIPREKIDEVVTKVKAMLLRKKSTLKEMQSLIGSLNFCCRAIAAGRPFCRCLINAICGLTKPFHHLHITEAMKLDLRLWLWFFRHHNGISVFHDRFWLSNDDANFYTDSAGGEGLGLVSFFKVTGVLLGGLAPERYHKRYHVSRIISYSSGNVHLGSRPQK